MTTRGKIWLLVGVGAVTGLTVLGIWGKKQYDKFKKNVVGFKAFQIKKLSAKELQFEVVMTYYNEMDFDIVLVDQNYDILLDGVYTTTLTNKSRTVLKSKMTSTIPLTISVEPKQLLRSLTPNIASLMNDMKNINVTIDMNLRVQFGILRIPVWYSYTDTIKRMAGLK